MFSLLYEMSRVPPERCEYCSVWPSIPCVLHAPRSMEIGEEGEPFEATPAEDPYAPAEPAPGPSREPEPAREPLEEPVRAVRP